MALFWILAAAMVALALAFVLVPIMRGSDLGSISRDALNVAVIKQQFAELEADLASGKLQQSEFEAARIDLERELLYDVEKATHTTAPKPQAQARWTAALLIVAIPIVAGALYWHLGSSQLIPVLQSQRAGNQVMSARAPQQPPAIEAMVAQLAARLRQQPNDLEGWQMLGRSYMVLRRYSDAASAYAKANELSHSSDPGLLVGYAEALALANGGRLAGQPATLLAKALALQPHNRKALWLSGYAHFQRQDFQQAITHWRRLLEKVPTDSEEAAQIRESIAQATAQLAKAGTQTQPVDVSESTTSTDQTMSMASAKTITTRVALADKLKEQVSPKDTVFILARAVNGPRMPLAVVRKQVKDLPLTITLDDSNAMSPALVLSSYAEVAVEARVSKSGDAIAQSGDLRGSSQPVKPGQEGQVDLMIDTVIP